MSDDIHVLDDVSAHDNYLTVGEFTIYQNDNTSVWIMHDSGEGGQFQIAGLESVIAEYYKDNF